MWFEYQSYLALLDIAEKGIFKNFYSLDKLGINSSVFPKVCV